MTSLFVNNNSEYLSNNNFECCKLETPFALASRNDHRCILVVSKARFCNLMLGGASYSVICESAAVVILCYVLS